MAGGRSPSCFRTLDTGAPCARLRWGGTPFDADEPLGSQRAIIRRNPEDPEEIEMVEARWGSNPRCSDGESYRFIRSEGKTFPSHRCLVPASGFHITVGARAIA
jgi:hypothetical protein